MDDCPKKSDSFEHTVQGVRRRVRELFGEQASVSEIARRIVQPRHNVDNYMTDRVPSLEFIWAVCMTQDVRAEWLLFGRGPVKLAEMDWSAVTYDELQEEAARRRLALESQLARIMEAFPLAKETIPLSEFARRANRAEILPGVREPKPKKGE